MPPRYDPHVDPHLSRLARLQSWGLTVCSAISIHFTKWIIKITIKIYLEQSKVRPRRMSFRVSEVALLGVASAPRQSVETAAYWTEFPP